MDRDRFWQLLTKVKVGEASPEDQLELNQYLAQHPADIDLINKIDSLWDAPFLNENIYGNDKTQQAWSKIQKQLSSKTDMFQRPSRNNKPSRLVKPLMTAAVFLALIGGVWWWNKDKLPDHLLKNTVSTKNGSKSKVDMPDGTQIWLNVGSRIEYDENFGKENREITLNGEAYFDVAHNDKKPFIIHTLKMNVKVLGTVFNVKAYAGDATTEATLIRGRIEVILPGRPTEKLVLKPSEKIAIFNDINQLSTTPSNLKNTATEIKLKIVFSSLHYQAADSSIIETAWVQNRFIFRSQRFDELSRMMERWFGISILVQDSAMLEEKFTGTFNNETITGALDALQLSYPFHYNYDNDNNTVTIYKK